MERHDLPEVLPHEGDPQDGCVHCDLAFLGYVDESDCPGRRLRAMADAVLQGRAGIHVRAVDAWHQKISHG